MYHDDVEGSRPKKKRVFKERDSMKISDIEKSGVTKPYFRKTHYDQWYAEVYAKDWQSKRVADPLDPTYKVRDTAKGHFTQQ